MYLEQSITHHSTQGRSTVQQTSFRVCHDISNTAPETCTNCPQFLFDAAKWQFMCIRRPSFYAGHSHSMNSVHCFKEYSRLPRWEWSFCSTPEMRFASRVQVTRKRLNAREPRSAQINRRIPLGLMRHCNTHIFALSGPLQDVGMSDQRIDKCVADYHDHTCFHCVRTLASLEHC